VLYTSHFRVFGILFLIWTLVFYMAGLYSKRALLTQYELTGAIVRTQLLNITIAALVFFTVPGIDIAPKTNLALYLVISLVLIYTWRLAILPRITRPTSRERAVLIGSGSDAQELVDEVNRNPRYRMEFGFSIDPEEASKDVDSFSKRLVDENIRMIVVDTGDRRVEPILARIYSLAFLEQRYGFNDLYRIYEEVFDRVPLSLLRYEWFLKNVSRPSLGFYAVLKRAVDIVGGLFMGIITLIATPFVAMLLQLEYPGAVFISQERIGQYGTRVWAYKFRTMRFGDRSVWQGEDENKVSRVGAFLRKTSLDEFPQFLNVLRGEISLVGPRNDIAVLGERLAETLPYYMARYMVKPGITGWAQINQQYEPGNISPQSIEETKTRLAYDFYYIKNRSFGLDVLIALRTFKRMFFRVSSW